MSNKIEDIENLLNSAFHCEGINNSSSKVAFMQVQINRVLEMLPELEKSVLQSLSQKIAEDVEKCELVDMEEEDDELECKDRPESQKCEGCKRALKIKGWLE